MSGDVWLVSDNGDRVSDDESSRLSTHEADNEGAAGADAEVEEIRASLKRHCRLIYSTYQYYCAREPAGQDGVPNMGVLSKAALVSSER